jgi:hypothetical protein
MTLPLGLYGCVWLLLGSVVAGVAWLICRDGWLSIKIGAGVGLAGPFAVAAVLDRDRRRR